MGKYKKKSDIPRTSRAQLAAHNVDKSAVKAFGLKNMETFEDELHIPKLTQ